MKIKIGLRENVQDAKENYKKILEKAIIEMMQQTKCRPDDIFHFKETVYSSPFYANEGRSIRCDIWTINGISYRKDMTLGNCYRDSDVVCSADNYSTELLEKIYRCVLLEVLNY